MKGKSLISINDYTKDEQISILDLASHFEKNPTQKILEDYEFIIREIRNFLDTEGIDNGTMNYLEDLIMNLEKDAWMVRSHIV